MYFCFVTYRIVLVNKDYHSLFGPLQTTTLSKYWTCKDCCIYFKFKLLAYRVLTRPTSLLLSAR